MHAFVRECQDCRLCYCRQPMYVPNLSQEVWQLALRIWRSATEDHLASFNNTVQCRLCEAQA